MRAIIFSGGVYGDVEHCREYLDGADLVIAADGGGMVLSRLEVTPDVVIGDMDSICKGSLRSFEESGVEIITRPPEKDYTDTELAFDLAIERGASEIIILGALGERMDHALANLSLLVKGRDKGITTRIIDERQELLILTPKIKNKLGGKPGDTISLISLSEKTEKVTTNDLKYPLSDGTLSLLSPLGVSNEISGPDPWVSYGTGKLLLVVVKKV